LIHRKILHRAPRQTVVNYWFWGEWKKCRWRCN
jgi:hypothetical protein